MKWLSVLLAAMANTAAPAATPQVGVDGPSTSLSQTKAILRELRKIVSPNGVEEQMAISVGGTRQWITVRGRDRRNPVLLLIHGGPASPETPNSWAFQGGWEDYFTVVEWDQRGSGKSYNENDPATVAPTLSLDRIVEDAGEVVQFLRKRYNKPKVFVVGHSWGSEVGLSLAQRHPEWLYAYVGMGQIINGRENESEGYRLTLQAAKAAGNPEAVRELESIAPYPNADGTVPLAKINLERKWSVFFGGLTAGRNGFGYYANAWDLSPDYSQADVDAIGKGSAMSLPRLLPDMVAFDFSKVTRFQVPIVIFAGRHDTTTPSTVTAAWLTRVAAPSKRLVWFENSAHMMPIEEPGRVLVHLVNDVRPLAGRDALSIDR